MEFCQSFIRSGIVTWNTMGFYAAIWVAFVGFSETVMEFWEGCWGIINYSTSWGAIPLGPTWNWMGKPRPGVGCGRCKRWHAEVQSWPNQGQVPREEQNWCAPEKHMIWEEQGSTQSQSNSIYKDRWWARPSPWPWFADTWFRAVLAAAIH